MSLVDPSLALIPLAEQTAEGPPAAAFVVFGTCLVLLTGAVLLMIRALRGPTVFDRILAVNAMGTKTVVLVACIAFLDLGHADPSFYLDTSIVYALINFVVTIAILKYIQYRRLS
ncbi:putative monovalent cation/H antiporter subunit F [Enhygromyxa salina]|uniref:Putative monovalent cation/H antiporter subunit F n=1 Tax=Enhygromyxa salina TaxID=215803 RepID=A0A2S9XY50_9BACT|nr:monovalent cation/H+ antiporter complex subunit F [Enhygromyxa salina]PRP97651.1 putative monovalent cation/H antiporter subunit F [Enhygromyxa salina]